MILLDTHVLLWLANEPERLSKTARDTIADARRTGGIAVATMTLWELAWIAENHRVVISGSVEKFVRETVSPVIVKPMTPEIVAVAVHLPSSFPKDPADRAITATAIAEDMQLVTADQRIRKSGIVRTIW